MKNDKTILNFIHFQFLCTPIHYKFNCSLGFLYQCWKRPSFHSLPNRVPELFSISCISCFRNAFWCPIHRHLKLAMKSDDNFFRYPSLILWTTTQSKVFMVEYHVITNNQHLFFCIYFCVLNKFLPCQFYVIIHFGYP